MPPAMRTSVRKADIKLNYIDLGLRSTGGRSLSGICASDPYTGSHETSTLNRHLPKTV